MSENKAPQHGSATAEVPSAGDEHAKAQAIVLADPTNVVTIGDYEAAKTDPSEGPHGMAHATVAGEIGGGNIKQTLAAPIDPATLAAPLTKEKAALLSSVGQKLAGFVGRPVSEWGLIGEGETVKGAMLLIDLHSGEKVRAADGHKVGKGRLYANLRNFPEALSRDDTIEQILH